jgi:hypothetical protein
MSLRLVRTLSALSIGTALLALRGAGDEAEYAVRWLPSEGGPATAADVLKLLELGDPQMDSFEVRYYDAPATASAPSHSRTILRERERDGAEDEILVKFRRIAPLEGDWTCPLGGGAKRSSQVDIGFAPDGDVVRVYAYSCEIRADSFPPSVHATPHACSVFFTRATAKKFKVETWPLPNGRALIDVSHQGPDSKKELAKFQKIVGRLLDAGAHPRSESKAELAGACL